MMKQIFFQTKKSVGSIDHATKLFPNLVFETNPWWHLSIWTKTMFFSDIFAKREDSALTKKCVSRLFTTTQRCRWHIVSRPLRLKQCWDTLGLITSREYKRLQKVILFVPGEETKKCI